MFGEANTSVRITELNETGLKETILGRENPSYTVAAGNWFAAELIDTTVDSYALCYCTVAPGFDFADFTMAHQAELLEQYPESRAVISRLCKN